MKRIGNAQQALLEIRKVIRNLDQTACKSRYEEEMLERLIRAHELLQGPPQKRKKLHKRVEVFALRLQEQLKLEAIGEHELDEDFSTRISDKGLKIEFPPNREPYPGSEPIDRLIGIEHAAKWLAISNLGGPFASRGRAKSLGPNFCYDPKIGYALPLNAKGIDEAYNLEFYQIPEHEEALPQEYEHWLKELKKAKSFKYWAQQLHKELGVTLTK